MFKPHSVQIKMFFIIITSFWLGSSVLKPTWSSETFLFHFLDLVACEGFIEKLQTRNATTEELLIAWPRSQVYIVIGRQIKSTNLFTHDGFTVYEQRGYTSSLVIGHSKVIPFPWQHAVNACQIWTLLT